MFGFFEDQDTDSELGQIVLERFNYFMQNKFFVAYSNDEIARAMGFKVTSILVDGIGSQFRLIGTDYGKLDKALKKLVDASAGKIPTKASLDAALRDEATSTFSFVDIQKDTNNPVVFVAVGIADDLLNGAQEIGDKVIDTGKNLLNFAPWLLIGGLAFYVYLQAKAAPGFKKGKA